jgi:hypothetical protein
MATTYPAQIDNSISLPLAIDNVTTFSADIVNRLRNAIINIESELGIKPSGLYGTVKTRLDTLEAVIASGGGGGGGSSITFAGDLAGFSTHQIVTGLQGNPVIGTPSLNQVLTWSGFAWIPAAIPTGFTAGSDLSGTATSQTVIGLHGNSVAAIAPTSGYALTWNGSAWAPAAIPAGFTAATDLSGTPTSQTVIKINSASVPAAGSLTTGNILQVNGASALTYAALNLAGGANYVTGALPSGNQAAQALTLTGDATSSGGNTGGATTVVAKINGASVSAAGALTTGNILQVSGSSALTYAALNLAGGAGYITGALPVGNQAYQAMAGDVTGTTAVSTVVKIQNNTVSSGGLTAGQVLTASTSSNWISSTLGNDVSASVGAPGTLSVNVIQITGATNNVLVLPTSQTWQPTSLPPLITSTAQVSTTNATPTTIFTFACPDLTVSDIAVTIVGKLASSTDTFRNDYRGTYSRNGGAPALQGTLYSGTLVATGGLSTASATLTISSNNVIAVVTGVVASNINWSIVAQIQERS